MLLAGLIISWLISDASVIELIHSIIGFYDIHMVHCSFNSQRFENQPDGLDIKYPFSEFPKLFTQPILSYEEQIGLPFKNRKLVIGNLSDTCVTNILQSMK